MKQLNPLYMLFPLSSRHFQHTNLLLTLSIAFLSCAISQDPAVQGYFIGDLATYYMSTFTNEAARWSISGLINPNVRCRTCSSSGYPYLGGWNIINNGGYYERTYTGLPPHDIVSFILKTMIIDRWNPTDSVSISLEGKTLFANINPGVYESTFSSDGCGSSTYKDLTIEFIGRIFHTGSSLTVRFTSNMDSFPLSGGFGARALNFVLGWKNPGDTEVACGTRGSDSGGSFSAPYMCPCYTDAYNAGGTCTNCSSKCRACYGSSANQCFGYDAGYSFDGTHVINCASGCPRCTGTGVNQCTSCSSPNIINWDNTCVASCTPPYIQENVGYSRCIMPCQKQDKFTLWDGSCSASCDPPLTQYTVGYAKFCSYSCTGATEYLRWDGVCVTTCEFPAQEVEIAGKKLCKYPCENSTYFISSSDNSCQVSCKYPFRVEIRSDIQYCVLDISQEEAKQVKQTAQISSVASDATNLGGTIITMLTFSNPGLLLMGSMTEMLQYIQYLNIDYPPRLYLMLQEQDVNAGGFSTITEIPPTVDEAIPNRPLPTEFEKNDTHSSFVANSWELLVSLCMILAIMLLLLTATTLTKKCPRISFALNKILGSLRWNLFLGVFCSSYGFSGMYTALEFRTVNMSSGLSILSFMISLLINVIGFFVLFLIVQFTVSINTIKTSRISAQEQSKQIEELEQKWRNFEVLFEEYKSDYMSQKMFLFIFILRTYLHYAVLGYLNDSPLLQTTFFTTMSVMMISYLAIRRPMKSRLNFLQQVICEIAILVVNICVLIFAMMEYWDIGTNDIKEKVGNIVVAVNLGLSFVSLFFLVIEILSKIKEAWTYLKNWYQANKKIKSQGLASMYGIKNFKIKHSRQLNGYKENNMSVSEMDIIHEISQSQPRNQNFDPSHEKDSL